MSNHSNPDYPISISSDKNNSISFSSNIVNIKQKEDLNTCTYYWLWFLFFLLGTFNNIGFVIVLSAAKSLADCFNESNLIGVESWALIGCGFIMKSMNAFYLESISHRVRGHITGFTFLIGYTLLSFSVYIDFWFAIFAILCIGAACSFGESVILGYCKLFPAKVSGAWSSGTGMAGLAGSGIYLLLAQVDTFTNQSIFMLMIPCAVVYIIAIELSWRSSLRKPWNAIDDKEPLIKEALIVNEAMVDIEIGDEGQWIQIKRCFMISWYRNVMLLFVYVFEYVISVGFAQIANTNKSNKEQDFDYVLLGLCYQLGVFLSRSSVSIIELPYFGTMTLLQLFNVILWAIHCETDLFHYEWIECILMVYVGLLGGAMYVNCAYSILTDKTVNDKDRELCMNLMALSVAVGITLSSIVELIMDNTYFSNLVHKSDEGGSSGNGCSTL